MDDPWVSGMVLHYSDFRISGFKFFGFFRIFALGSHNIDSIVLNFGMGRLESLTLESNLSDFPRIFPGFFPGFSPDFPRIPPGFSPDFSQFPPIFSQDFLRIFPTLDLMDLVHQTWNSAKFTI